MTATYKPRHFRIYRRVTTSTILTVEDALNLGKVKWTLTTYTKGAGSTASVEHYMDTETAALLAYDLLAYPQTNPADRTWWNGYTEFKGTAKAGTITSRCFRVDLETDTKNPIRFSISNGPGELLNAQGAIKPKSGVDKETVRVTTLLPWQAARTLAIALHHHIAAYLTMTYYSRIQEETWTPGDNGQPPTVDPDTGELLDD